MPLVYDITLGPKMWDCLFSLAQGELRNELHEFNETGIPSEEYKIAYNACVNMLMGKYWTYNDVDWRKEEEVIAFYADFPNPWNTGA